MTYEFLPRPEPGEPPMKFSPGFADRVLERFREGQRRRKRRRTIAVVVTALCLVGGVFLLSARMMDAGRTPSVPQTQAGPVVTPLVKPAPAQQPAPAQNAVRQARTAPPTSHDHPVTTASAETHPQYVVITLDGKEYHCPPDFLHRLDNGDSQIEQVRDGKRANHTVPVSPGLSGPCRAAPSPGH